MHAAPQNCAILHTQYGFWKVTVGLSKPHFVAHPNFIFQKQRAQQNNTMESLSLGEISQMLSTIKGESRSERFWS